MHSLRQKAVVATAITLTALVLAGCGTADAVDQAPPAESKTMVVDSEFGKVTLPAAPTKALGMYTTDVDILITLGIPLAEQQPIRGDGWTDFPTFFPQDELKDIKPFANYPDYNFEKILGAQPDFILNGLGYDADVVKKLPGIAPTYSVDAFDGRSWLEHFKETATALGRLDKYDEWIDRYEARVAQVKAAIGDRGSSLVVAPVSSYEGKVSSSCYSGVECQAFRDLGLTVLPGSQKNNGKGLDLSLEQVGQLDTVDYAFTIQTPGEKGAAEYAALQKDLLKNKLWARLDFVKKDQIVAYDMEMTYGSPSGQMAFLDVVEKALTR